MLEHLLIISPRGDSIVNRDFRRRGTRLSEQFLKAVRCGGPSTIPIANLAFSFIKRSGLYFVIAADHQVAPISVWIELLESIVRIIKDFCGVLTEESIRRNFSLVHELIDEVFDFGYMQANTTKELTEVIRNEPTPNDPIDVSASALSATAAAASGTIAASLVSISAAGLSHLTQLATGTSSGVRTIGRNLSAVANTAAPRTVPSNASQAPVLHKGDSVPEIFIDVLDRISADMEAWTGNCIDSRLDGLVVVKSYLQDVPNLKIGFNENLIVRNKYLSRNPQSTTDEDFAGGGPVVLDDVLFHETVTTSDEFSTTKSICFPPGQGEFILMRFRAGMTIKPPLILVASINVLSADKIELTCKLRVEHGRGDIAGVASIITELPRWISGATVTPLDSWRGQPVQPGRKPTVTFSQKRITWTNRAMDLSAGGEPTGYSARLSVDLSAAPRPVVSALKMASLGIGTQPIRIPGEEPSSTPERFLSKYLGPFNLNFELPMHSLSRLQIRYLRSVSGPPLQQRWVRYVTQSGSFVARF